MIRSPAPFRSLPALLLLAVAACSPLPDTGLGNTVTQNKTAPAEAKLVPVDGLLADADAFVLGGASVGSLDARAAALRARAAELRRR